MPVQVPRTSSGSQTCRSRRIQVPRDLLSSELRPTCPCEDRPAGDASPWASNPGDRYPHWRRLQASQDLQGPRRDPEGIQLLHAGRSEGFVHLPQASSRCPGLRPRCGPTGAALLGTSSGPSGRHAPPTRTLPRPSPIPGLFKGGRDTHVGQGTIVYTK